MTKLQLQLQIQLQSRIQTRRTRTRTRCQKARRPEVRSLGEYRINYKKMKWARNCQERENHVFQNACSFYNLPFIARLAVESTVDVTTHYAPFLFWALNSPGVEKWQMNPRWRQHFNTTTHYPIDSEWLAAQLAAQLPAAQTGTYNVLMPRPACWELKTSSPIYSCTQSSHVV